jgi:hypothetical protein
MAVTGTFNFVKTVVHLSSKSEVTNLIINVSRNLRMFQLLDVSLLFFDVDLNISATVCNAVQRPYEKQNTIMPSYCGYVPDSFCSPTRIEFIFWMS